MADGTAHEWFGNAGVVRDQPVSLPGTDDATLEAFWRSLAQGAVTWQRGSAAAAPWQALFREHARVVDSVRAEGTLFLLVVRPLSARAPRPPIGAKHRTILERCAQGEPCVNIAVDFGKSASSLCETLSRLMRRLGLRSRAELLWFCREDAGLSPPSALVAAAAHTAQDEVTVLAAPMGPAGLAKKFTRAEADIVLRIIAGQSNGAIAHARGTSLRTVANQVAALCRKLGADTRCQVIVKSRVWAPSAPPPDCVPLAVVRRFCSRLGAGQPPFEPWWMAC